jgi:hypothetical protein
MELVMPKLWQASGMEFNGNQFSVKDASCQAHNVSDLLTETSKTNAWATETFLPENELFVTGAHWFYMVIRLTARVSGYLQLPLQRGVTGHPESVHSVRLAGLRFLASNSKT